jgi:hypothetical protein
VAHCFERWIRVLLTHLFDPNLKFLSHRDISNLIYAGQVQSLGALYISINLCRVLLNSSNTLAYFLHKFLGSI